MIARSGVALSLAASWLAGAATAQAQEASPCLAPEEAKLVPSGSSMYDALGISVAISGDTAVAGAPGTGAGAAYVSVRNEAGWSEQAVLAAGDPTILSQFGLSAAISGDTVVVGAPAIGAGAAYVFVRAGTTWSQQQKLMASDGVENDQFGWSVAISGDTAVVAAPEHGGAGAAYVFVRNGTNWSEQQELTAGDAAANDQFGCSVALESDTVVIGAGNDDHNTGSAYVFLRYGTSWSEQQKLTASDGQIDDWFGASVALSGDTIVVGAPHDDYESGPNAGSAYVYERNAASWHERQKLTASDGEGGDWFGYAVAVSTDRSVVGAVLDDFAGKARPGSAYAYVRDGAGWVEEQHIAASDANASDSFGRSVAIAGDRAAVGAPEKEMVELYAGAAYVFDLSTWNSDWVAYCTAGTSASGCQVALYGCGAASASATAGFEVTAASVEAKKDGLFFFGTNGRQANSWGNGSSFQCVVPPVVRTGVFAGIGLLGTCNPSYSLDLNAYWCPSCPDPQKNPGAGAVVQLQFWYRDPLSTSNQTTSFSDAIEVPVHP